MKKIKNWFLFSLLTVGFAAAMPAFALLGQPGSGVAAQGQSGQMMYWSQDGAPCQAFDANGNMMSQRTCGNVYFSGNARAFEHSMAPWFALMFVLTVAMVWAILLLLIGILWHILKKHRKGHVS